MKSDRYSSILVLTGAGISAESGVATFRGAGGLWNGYRIEEVATPEGFAINPQRVHEFYNLRRRELQNPHIQPNSAHVALAELEEKFSGDVLIVTQNIDDLHERAGSKRLIHMHGELLKAECIQCHHVFTCSEDLGMDQSCPACHQPGKLRPYIVWFGEMPRFMTEIGVALSTCDLFIAIGTSGQVYPAAGFVQEAHRFGSHTIEVNLDPSAVGTHFDEQLYGPATQVVPSLVHNLLSE